MVEGTLPNFLVIGAQRSGTTYLHNLLCQHLRIRDGRTKEIHYFDKHYAKGEEFYRSQFTKPPKDDILVLDSTPYYLFDPRVPLRVASLLPSAKFIVLLRNPVDRAYSHYNLQRRRGDEPLDTFEDALEAEPKRLALAEQEFGGEAYQHFAHRRFSYVSRGHYAEQLEGWFAIFSRESFLIVQSERFYADPMPVVSECARHVGAKPRSRVREEPSGAKNIGEYKPMSVETRRRLTEHFASHNRRLYDLLDVDFGWA